VLRGASDLRDAPTRPTGADDDLLRLERAVRALVGEIGRLREENGSLRGRLGERDREVDHLGERLVAANQQRRDALKCIDDLVARLDNLDERLSTPPTGPDGSAERG